MTSIQDSEGPAIDRHAECCKRELDLTARIRWQWANDFTFSFYLLPVLLMPAKDALSSGNSETIGHQRSEIDEIIVDHYVIPTPLDDYFI